MFLLPPLGPVRPDFTQDPRTQELIHHGWITLSTHVLVTCKGKSGYSFQEQASGCGEWFELPQPLDSYSNLDEVTCTNCGASYIVGTLGASLKQNTELVAISFVDLINALHVKLERRGVSMSPIEGIPWHYELSVPGHRWVASLQVPPALRWDVDERIAYVQFQQRHDLSLPTIVAMYSGIELILNEPDVLINDLQLLPPVSTINQRLQKISNIWQRITALGNTIRWQTAENEFTQFVFTQLRGRAADTARLRAWLHRYPSFDVLPVHVGGAGKPDWQTVRLSDYLTEIFNGDLFTGDTKLYSRRRVSKSDIETVQRHLSKAPGDTRRALILATTDDITVWDDVESYRRNTGRHRILILSARILAELAVHLEFDDDFVQLMEGLSRS